MASSTAEIKVKGNLADFIKSVHGNLRKQVQKANGDFNSVWHKHCRNSLLLQQYSQSMKELAVEHWRGNNLRRMEWCKAICVEYFYEGGCEKCLRKDCRRVLFNADQHKNCKCQSEAECLQLELSREDYQVNSDKLVLLDVGSCFNPFQAFPDIFIPLAIDLCPAVEVSLSSNVSTITELMETSFCLPLQTIKYKDQKSPHKILITTIKNDFADLFEESEEKCAFYVIEVVIATRKRK